MLQHCAVRTLGVHCITYGRGGWTGRKAYSALHYRYVLLSSSF